MVKFEFESIKFSENNKNGEKRVRATFLKIYYFDISSKELSDIGPYSIEDGYLIFKDISEKKADNKFSRILEKGFVNLYSKLNSNKTIYVHSNSGIPLIGSNSFGLVDRDTNLIEIKPITGCNLNCTFCSVDEGIDTKKKLDFVVEKDYLVSEFKKLASHKNCDPLYAYINVHGEPMLYEEMVELIRDLKKIDGVITGIITNGTLLNEKIIDELISVGLDRFNISLNAFSSTKAKELAGTKAYNFNRLKDILRYVNSKMELVIAPLFLQGLNEEDMDGIIEFVLELRKESFKKGFPLLGIQNFLGYKLGRNPVKQFPWDKFNEKIKRWEEKHGIDLSEGEFYDIFETVKLEKPFKKNDVVKAKIVSSDRYPNQRICVAENRIISLLECDLPIGKQIKVRIVRDKHNIFVGTKV